MSEEKSIVPDASIEEIIGESGKVKRPRRYEGVAAFETSPDAIGTDGATAPAGNADRQTLFGGERPRRNYGLYGKAAVPGAHTPTTPPDTDGEAPVPEVWNRTAGRNATAPADGNNREDVATGMRAASTADSEERETGVQTATATPTASAEQSEASAPAPQTATAGSSADGGDTAPATPAIDTETTRRTPKQRKSELDEYRRRYMQTPRIEDRKPVFVSRTTRDRLDRIVRLLGERGMSVSGLIENIAVRHLADHEPDIDYWRRM